MEFKNCTQCKNWNRRTFIPLAVIFRSYKILGGVNAFLKRIYGYNHEKKAVSGHITTNNR